MSIISFISNNGPFKNYKNSSSKIKFPPSLSILFNSLTNLLSLISFALSFYLGVGIRIWFFRKSSVIWEMDSTCKELI
jgi:hypothetical protein